MSNLLHDLEQAETGTTAETAAVLAAMRWNEQGLVPAIAQDAEHGDVLMLAWMNEAALRETLETGRACYWSRSRGRLWRKGEESGHVQHIREVRIDCDGDTVLLSVTQAGAACHTGRRHCFYLRMERARAEITLDVDVDPAQIYGAK